MCLAIPAEVVEISTDTATAVVDAGGARKRISVTLVDDLAVGDYVLVHAGFAINKIDEDEAMKTIELLRELAEHEAGFDEIH